MLCSLEIQQELQGRAEAAPLGPEEDEGEAPSLAPLTV